MQLNIPSAEQGPEKAALEPLVAGAVEAIGELDVTGELGNGMRL